MKEIITLLPYLVVAVACNIGTGMYNKIGIDQINFSFKKLIVGVIKAGIVCGAFIGLAYISQAVDIGISSKALLLSAIILYSVKSYKNLKKILGVKDDEVTKPEVSE